MKSFSKILRICALVLFICAVLYVIINSFVSFVAIPYIGDLFIALATILVGTTIVEEWPNKHLMRVKDSKNWIYKYTYLIFLKLNDKKVYDTVLSEYIAYLKKDIKNLDSIIKKRKFMDVSDEAKKLSNDKWLLEHLEKITNGELTEEQLLQTIYDNHIADVAARYSMGLYTENHILELIGKKTDDYTKRMKHMNINFIDKEILF